jgi:hypothetical protein
MKKAHKIALSAGAGIIILALVWPVLDYGIYFTDPMGTLLGVFTILLAVTGALLLSYAARQVHPALVPLLWAAFFLLPLVRFLAGNSDGPMEDLAWILFLGTPGIWLLVISVRTSLKARRSISGTRT